MATWKYYLPLVGIVFAAIAIVPFIGGACLLLTSRLAKVPSATYLRCYLAYLTAYLAATLVTLPISLIGSLLLQVPDYVLWPACFLLAIGIHMVIIPKFLQMSIWKGLVVHGAAVLLVALVLGLMVAVLLWFSLESIRERTQIVMAMNNLKQIGNGLQYHLEQEEKFPAAASYAKNGRPLLSWRVHLLPFLEQQPLYEQFHLDEPWDSPHNKPLLEKMPAIYAPSKNAPNGHSTYFQLFARKIVMAQHPNPLEINPYHPLEAPFLLIEGGDSGPLIPEYLLQRAQQGLGHHMITDGLSRTFCVAEGGTAVPWTKPDDIPYSPDQPLPELGGMFGEGFLVLLFDGSVRRIGTEEKEAVIRASITADGREENQELSN